MCHCKFHQSYRRFTTRHHQLIPIFGFGRRSKSTSSTHRHWLSGKGSSTSVSSGGGGGGGSNGGSMASGLNSNSNNHGGGLHTANNNNKSSDAKE